MDVRDLRDQHWSLLPSYISRPVLKALHAWTIKLSRPVRGIFADRMVGGRPWRAVADLIAVAQGADRRHVRLGLYPALAGQATVDSRTLQLPGIVRVGGGWAIG